METASFLKESSLEHQHLPGPSQANSSHRGALLKGELVVSSRKGLYPPLGDFRQSCSGPRLISRTSDFGAGWEFASWLPEGWDGDSQGSKGAPGWFQSRVTSGRHPPWPCSQPLPASSPEGRSVPVSPRQGWLNINLQPSNPTPGCLLRVPDGKCSLQLYSE